MKDNPRIVFDAVYKMHPALRAEGKAGKTKILTAKINRMMVEQAASETGLSLAADPVLDMLRVEAPNPADVLGGFVVGTAFEVQLLASPGWKKMKIKGVEPLGADVLRVVLEPEFA